MGSSVNSLKSPLCMRKPLHPSGCRRREAHLSGASPRRVRSVPAASRRPADRVAVSLFWAQGHELLPLGRRKRTSPFFLPPFLGAPSLLQRE